MKKDALRLLFIKYHEGTCTEEEEALLEKWYLEYNEQETGLSPKKISAIGARLFRELPGNHGLFITNGIKLAIAALVFGSLITVCFKFLILPPVKPNTNYTETIKPGSNQATLTLANGKTLNLGRATSGQLAVQSGSLVIKAQNGQISYQRPESRLNSRPEGNNMITTPNGGQWQVVLPDGSTVWLNAASSLTYPTSFANQSRRIVRLTGEAYFEVAKDKAHPFEVQTKGQIIQVLGTHFNVSAYDDERTTKTSLAEGRVKVTGTDGKQAFLLPGKQAVLRDHHLTVSDADLEETLAWKNGYFRFNDEDIQSIMRSLSRWYNVEIRYEGPVPAGGLNGKVSRSKNISQVLKALEATQTVHFKTEGRRITVIK